MMQKKPTRAFKARASTLSVRLSERYPIIFNRAAPLPLAKGIHFRIMAETGQPRRLVTLAMHWWTSQRTYLAVAAAGGQRFDLDGNVAGEITEDERAHFAERLVAKDKYFADRVAAEALIEQGMQDAHEALMQKVEA